MDPEGEQLRVERESEVRGRVAEVELDSNLFRDMTDRKQLRQD